MRETKVIERDDDLFLSRLSNHLTHSLFIALILGVSILQAAWADGAYIPPNSNAAVVSQAAHGSGVGYSGDKVYADGSGWKTLGRNVVFHDANGNNVARNPSGKFNNINQSGYTYNASKSHPTTFTGSYGETARGTLQTSTQVGSSSALSKGFGAFAVGAMATSHHQNLQNQGVADQISRGFSDGNWSEVVSGVGKMFDWTGIGNIYAQALYGNQAVQQGVFAPVYQQTLETARQQFDDYQRTRENIDPSRYNQYITITVHEWGQGYDVYRKFLVPSSVNVDGMLFQRQQKETTFPLNIATLSIRPTIPLYDQYGYSTWLSVNAQGATHQDVLDHNAQTVPPLQLPTEAQWANAMQQFLNGQNATNQALRDLTNALWASGALNLNNTHTMVTGSADDRTFVSPAYTPAGTQQAQQTQWQVAPNGQVNITYIPRPDLGAGSSQAPTRSPVGKPSRGKVDIDVNTGSSDKPQSLDVCDKDDEGKVVCLEAGSDDYTDLSVPESKQPIRFDHEEYFNSHGSCPANPTFTLLGHSYTFSYEPACKIAIYVSPMIELCGIVLAAAIAYGAVREL